MTTNSVFSIKINKYIIDFTLRVEKLEALQLGVGAHGIWEWAGVCRYEMGAVPALSLIQRPGKAMRSRVGWGVRAWEVQWQHPSLEGNTV